jgi:hypothetical protein
MRYRAPPKLSEKNKKEIKTMTDKFTARAL